MRLYEHEAKQIFKQFGISVPISYVVKNEKEAYEAAAKIGKSVVVKAQILVGGRGKTGGIKFSDTPDTTKAIAKKMFNSQIKGLNVNKLLIEEKLDIDQEFYVGVTVDNRKGAPVVMVSSKGGIDIEEVAKKNPEKIGIYYPDIIEGLREYQARHLLKTINVSGKPLAIISNIMLKLFQIFRMYDSEIIEINPLVITKDGKILAADGRLNVDDHALFRHPNLKELRVNRFENSLEREGQTRNVNFIDLQGSIAIMGNGAGLVMALLDSVKRVGGTPACFLDTGGGLSADKVEKALDLLLIKAKKDKTVKAIFFAFWFMISPAEEVKEGFLRIISEKKPQIPIIGVIQGVGAQRASTILNQAGIKCFSSIEEGVKEVVKVSK